MIVKYNTSQFGSIIFKKVMQKIQWYKKNRKNVSRSTIVHLELAIQRSTVTPLSDKISIFVFLFEVLSQLW